MFLSTDDKFEILNKIDKCVKKKKKIFPKNIVFDKFSFNHFDFEKSKT